jgi:paired amphipathic helix protein Sin3a
MYLRSLDHQGIQVKQADKKNFSVKHLVDAIKTKHEELRRQKKTNGTAPLWQYSWQFDDTEIMEDALRLMISYVNTASQHNNLERRRISDFFEKFIQMFFDLNPDNIAERLQDIERATPDDDSEEASPIELPNGRGKRTGNGKKNNDLRRGVLDKARNGNRGGGRGQKEDSVTGSKESTPDLDSAADEDPEEPELDNYANEDNWANRARPVDTHDGNTEDLDFSADQPFSRDGYKLWCNQTLYVFVSLLHTLYDRLKEIKDSESEAREETVRLTRDKPARQMGLMNHKDDYYQDLTSGETYYQRTLALIEDFINGDVDETQFQASIRQYYLKRGWRIYTIQDFLKHLARLGAVCTSGDSKEKTPLLLDLFYKNRSSKETTYNTEITMRKQAQKWINKDADLFLVQWVGKNLIRVGIDYSY